MMPLLDVICFAGFTGIHVRSTIQEEEECFV